MLSLYTNRYTDRLGQNQLDVFEFHAIPYNFSYMRKQHCSSLQRLFYCIKVHNQRIERLWRDVFQNCSLAFYNAFYQLEESGDLNIDNEVHVTCLQFAYLRLYNSRLSDWVEGWNRHKLRTEGHRSPMQLWQSMSHHGDDNDQV